MRRVFVAATILAASLTVPVTAHADCGDPGQDPCTGPVPTVYQVAGLLSELTDPDRPAASKVTSSHLLSIRNKLRSLTFG
jgi:hypothetical protein